MELSGFEMVLIFLIALLVLGPEELLKHAVSLGRLVGKMRTQFNNFKVMTQEELLRRAELGDVDAIKDVTETVQGLGREIQAKTGQHVSLLGGPASAPRSVESEVENRLLNLGDTVPPKKDGGT